MVEAKLLLVLILAVVVFGLYLLLTSGSRVLYEEQIDKGVDLFVDAGQCQLGFLDPDCSRKETEDACEYETNSITGEKKPTKCNWCVGEVNGQKVSTCRLDVCGCGAFYSEESVEISVGNPGRPLDKTFKAGDTLRVIGKITTKSDTDRTGYDVKLSFLDKDRRKTNELGAGGTASTRDREGNFEFDYKIPSKSQASTARGPNSAPIPWGQYYVLAEYGEGRAMQAFLIEEGSGSPFDVVISIFGEREQG